MTRKPKSTTTAPAWIHPLETSSSRRMGTSGPMVAVGCKHGVTKVIGGRKAGRQADRGGPMSYPVHAESPVGELAAHVPGSARVFDRLGLDFCCGGGQTLSAACAERGLAVEGVMRELEAEAAAHAGTVSDAARWNQAPLWALCDYIVTRHHQYIRSEVPRIERWLEKCVAAHGARHPELARMRDRKSTR